MTLTAMRPDSGFSKGLEVSLCSVAPDFFFDLRFEVVLRHRKASVWRLHEEARCNLILMFNLLQYSMFYALS